MPSNPEYTAVSMTNDAKASLRLLQVVLSARAGRRLTYSGTLAEACRLLAPDNLREALDVWQETKKAATPSDPCAGGCSDPARHAEGGHDV